MKRIYKIALLTSLSAIAFSCGVKGSPMPPLTNAPATVKQINIKQQGDKLVVYWKYTPRYADGRSMQEKFRFKVYSLEHPIIKNINSLGNLYWFRYKFTSDKEYCFKIKVITSNAESRFSRYFCYIPTYNYPNTHPHLLFSITPNGIKISWEKTDLKINIYKSPQKTKIPISYVSLIGETSFIDSNVSSNKKYCYYSTFENPDGVESQPSQVKCIVFKDIFPPLPPVNPQIIKKGKNYYLVWSESPSKDVIGYLIYVNNKPLNKVPVKSYIIKLGRVDIGSIISIRAIDKNNNLSKPVSVKLNSEQP